MAISESPFQSAATASHTEVALRFCQDLYFLRIKYGLQVHYGEVDEFDAPYIEELKPLHPLKAALALEAIRGELTKYPPLYVAFCKVKRLRLAQSLKLKSSTLFDGPDFVGGAITPDGQIYLSFGLDDPDILRKPFHHELKHRSDDVYVQFLAGLPMGRRRLLSYSNRWIRLNPEGTRIYLGKTIWNKEERAKLDFYSAGFGRYYGRANEAEDRATMAEAVMTELKFTYYRTSLDPVLRRKIERTKKDFRVRSRGLMNEVFFQDLSQDRVTENYWIYNPLPRSWQD